MYVMFLSEVNKVK